MRQASHEGPATMSDKTPSDRIAVSSPDYALSFVVNLHRQWCAKLAAIFSCRVSIEQTLRQKEHEEHLQHRLILETIQSNRVALVTLAEPRSSIRLSHHLLLLYLVWEKFTINPKHICGIELTHIYSLQIGFIYAPHCSS